MSDQSLVPGVSPDLGAPPSYLDKIQPQTFEGLVKLAEVTAMAGWAPKSYEVNGKVDSNKVIIGMMMAVELKLQPLSGIQNIAVVNGIPSIYGDAMLAIVRRSGLLEDFKETAVTDDKGKVVGYKTWAKRAGQETPIETQFLWADAKAANLIGKSGPWTQYEARMFQMRSRSLCLRDGFSDVLKGLTSVEEAQDITIVSNVPVKSALTGPGKGVTGRLNAFAGTTAPADAETAASDAESGTTDAVFEDVKHDEDGVVSEEMPEPVAEAFIAGNYAPYLPWLANTLHPRDNEGRQAVVDDQMANIKIVRGSSERALAMVDKLAKDFEITLSLETETT